MRLIKIEIKKILWFVFFSLLLLGCKKDPFDYRSKFIGNYHFSIHETAWNLSGYIVDTTYSYVGEIQNGKESNTVVIYFSKNKSIEATVYEDGTLSKCVCTNYGNLKGEFESAKGVKFILGSSGLGGGGGYNVTGEKK